MRLRYSLRLQGLAVAAMLPLLFAFFLCRWPWSWWIHFPALLAGGLFAFWCLQKLALQAERPLQTLSNLLAAIREGDYSFRARRIQSEDPLAHVWLELNTLSELLQQQRIKALEATALLQAVVSEIDVAVLVFDDADRLRMMNRAAGQMLGSIHDSLLGRPAASLGLSQALGEERLELMDLTLPGRAGRFEVRRTFVREEGRSHRLLVISDLTRTLREEERQAWQKLIRVLGHEINNSLAPIASLSESLVKILEVQGMDWMQDAKQGLSIISSRASGLSRFTDAYTRLAKLPEPNKREVEIQTFIKKAVALETQHDIQIEPGPAIRLMLDEDQMLQALMNLLRNAVEAMQEEPGGVSVRWEAEGTWVSIAVQDDGPGLPKGGNLFVPFFTTKPTGSGIGLVLSRQIAENHGGTLHLQDRPSRKGVQAVLRLPLA